MKKLLLLCSTALMLFVGCSEAYDDSAILDRLDDLEQEQEDLKEQVDAMQTLLNASANNLSIVSVIETEEGYVVTFSDKSTIVVNHGEKGEDGEDGKDGTDGDTFFDSITWDEEYVYFTLADGTVVTIPLSTSESNGGNQVGEHNKIYYTTTDGKKLFPKTDAYLYGAILVSNTYKDGQGVLVFDDTITSIGEYAFRDCSTLASIAIPDSVTSIGNSAFSHCSSLASITIPSSVTHIGYQTFYGCKGELIVNCNILDADSADKGVFYGSQFTSVIMGDSVTSIGNYAFWNCSSLTSVTISDSVTSIGYYVFDGCTNLKSIVIPNGVIEIAANAFSGYTGELIINNKKLVETDRDYKYRNPFKDSDFSKLTIGDNIEKIGAYAFSYCSSITSVTIPESVTSIGGSAFSGCSSLASVTIPDSVTSIGRSAFSHCESLASVTIPQNVTSIGIQAFDYCSSLPIENNIRYADTYLVEPVDKTLSSYTIKEGTKFIGGYAFEKCSNLTSITIPESVTSIGDSAFRNCSSLTSITIPNSVTTIDVYAFYGCSSLESVTIPESVTEIGYKIFYGCSNLAEFKGKFASGDGRCLIIDETLNSFAPAGLTEYTIQEGVRHINYGAFSKCSNLTSVTIPESVTSIANYAFDYCSNLAEFKGKFASSDGRCLIVDGTLNSFAPAGLTEYTICDSIASIGTGAFWGCSSLESATIPEGVTSIGDSVFYGCSSLAEVYCKATNPPTAELLASIQQWRAFNSNSSGRKIYVPTESVNAYKGAEGWSEYADDIVGYDFD